METLNCENVIGLTFESAQEIAKQENSSLRLVEKDGEKMMGICDFKMSRINVEVVDGKIVRAYFG